VHVPYDATSRATVPPGVTSGCPVQAGFDPPDQEVPFHPNISFRAPQELWVRT
jgi:hypothetical protein